MNIQIDLKSDRNKDDSKNFYTGDQYMVYNNTPEILNFSIGYIIHDLEEKFFNSFISCKNNIEIKFQYCNLYRNHYSECLRNYNGLSIDISNSGGKCKSKYRLVTDPYTGLTVIKFNDIFKKAITEKIISMLNLFNDNVKPKQLRFGTSPFDSLAEYAGLKGDAKTDPVLGTTKKWPLENWIVSTFLEAGFLDIIPSESSFINRIFNIRISKKGYILLRKSLMREGRVSGKTQQDHGWHGAYKNTLDLMDRMSKLDTLFNIQKEDKK